MRITKSFIIYQSPAILIAILIFVFSSIPYPPDIKLSVSNEDLIKHAIAYSIFGFFLARALYHQDRFPKLRERHNLFTFILGSLYGISDEFHQFFVPGRSSEVSDLLADSFGILIGMLLFNYLKNLQKTPG